MGFRLPQQSTRMIRATSFRDSWRTLQSLLLMPSATFAGIFVVRVYGPWSSGWDGGLSDSLEGAAAAAPGTFFAAGGTESLLLGDAGETRDTVVFFDGDTATAAEPPLILFDERTAVGEGGGELLGFFATGCWVARRDDFFTCRGTVAEVGWRFSCDDESLAEAANAEGAAAVVVEEEVFAAEAMEEGARADDARPAAVLAAVAPVPVEDAEEAEGFAFLPLRARTFSRRFVSEAPLRAAVIFASGTNSCSALMHFPVSSRTSEFSCVIVVLNGTHILSTLASSCVGSAVPNFPITLSKKVSV